MSIPELPQEAHTIVCIFCRGSVKFLKFFLHIQNDHDILFDHDLMLKINMIGKDAMVEIMKEFVQTDDNSLPENDSKNEVVDEGTKMLNVTGNKEKVDTNAYDSKRVIKEEKHDDSADFEVFIEMGSESDSTEDNIEMKDEQSKPPQGSIKAGDKIDKETDIIFQCDLCENKYKNKKQLRKHINLKHLEETSKTKQTNNHEKVKCTVADCDKIVLKSRLRRHSLTHSEQKPFACAECEKCFRRGDHLKKHMKVHTVSESLAENVRSKLQSG